jgi:membrane protein insertase Oxa1/YidC/SpoIIIJ
MIGFLPIMMGITMWIQMRINPAPPDPTQAMIFNWMPVVFTFLLASFPAGLVLYWTWNNLLSILQQAFIMKKHGVDINLLGNIKQSLGLGTRRTRRMKPGSNRLLFRHPCATMIQRNLNAAGCYLPLASSFAWGQRN